MNRNSIIKVICQHASSKLEHDKFMPYNWHGFWLGVWRVSYSYPYHNKYIPSDKDMRAGFHTALRVIEGVKDDSN